MASTDEDVPAASEPRREEPIRFPRTNLFIFLTVLAIAVGIGLGIGLRSVPGWDYYKRQKLFYLRFPGDLLINMQKMMILPLVVSSMVSSLASLKGKASGKMGFRAVVYYLSVSLFGVIIGVTLILTVRPGQRGGTMLSTENQTKQQEPLYAIFDLIRNCFPDNLIAACFQRQTTVVRNFTYQLPTTEQTEENKTSTSSTTSLNNSTPATVIVGIVAHAFIILPLVFFVITKKNPFLFMFNMLKALLTAWVTSSSLATLPITMECLEVKNKTDMRVAKFMTPIGATVNIASAGVYEVIAALFISQINGMALDVGQLVTISLAAVIATIGTGLPSDILITMSVALTAAGLPVEDIGVVVAVDWFLDRFCTPVNVLASAFGVGIVQHLSRNDLQALEDRESNGFTVQTINIKEDPELEHCVSPTFTTTL